MGLTIIRGRTRVLYDDFSGGLDFVTNPASLPANRVPAATNMTLRGTDLVQRYGFESNVYISGATDVPQYVFWQLALGGYVFVQEGAKLCRYTEAGGSWTTRTVVHTFTTSAKIACCVFGGRLIVTHPVDGTYRSAATPFGSLTSVSATVTGSAIAVWENKVWVTGDLGLRVYWSNPGDAATWTTADDYVDIRAVDDEPCTAIGSGNGMDVVGRSGLLVFKGTSFYRIYDSTTGAYTVVSTDKGAAGAEAVTSGPDGIYAANQYGVYRIRGDSVDTISDPVRNRWDYGGYSSGETSIAWSSNGRHFFADTRASFNYPIFEWEPLSGSWYLHTYKDSSGNPRKVLSATSESMFNTAIPQGYLLVGDSGVDTKYNVLTHFAPPESPAYISLRKQDMWNPSTGAVSYAHSGYLRTPWIGGGLDLMRCDRVIVHGFAGGGAAGVTDDSVAVTVYKDFRQADGGTSLDAITFPNTGALSYDVESAAVTINHLGVARAFQLELSHAAAAINRTTGLPVDTAVAIAEAPSFGISAVQADLIALRA